MVFPPKFREAFFARYKTSCGYLGTEVLFSLGTQCDNALDKGIRRCPLSWKYVMPALDPSEFTVYNYNCLWGLETKRIFLEKLRAQLLRAFRVHAIMKRFVRSWKTWYYTKVLRVGHILARYRKEKLPDARFILKYHPIRDEYFSAAFSGRFPKNLETDGNGNTVYVIHAGRMGTSQEAISMFCRFTQDPFLGRVRVHRFLEDATGDPERFQKAYQELQVLADEFMHASFGNCCVEFLNHYLNETMLRVNHMTSIQRLERFVRQNPILAEFIWKGNFSTREQRAVLADRLCISKKNKGGFIRSENLTQLREFVDRKTHKKDSLLDMLPPHLWARIQDAEKGYQQAQLGSPVGLFGTYISGDAVDMWRNRVREAWRDADIWIGRHQLQQSRG